MMIWLVLGLNIAISMFVFLFFVWNIYAIISGAPFVPSSKKRIVSMIALANLKKSDVMLDVGSGEGKILRAVSPYVKEARGVEINPTLVWWSRAMNRITRKNNVRVARKNFWALDLSGIDVLFVYCIDTKMERLEKKLVQEMPAGSRVLSNGFTLPSLQPVKQKDGVSLYIL